MTIAVQSIAVTAAEVAEQTAIGFYLVYATLAVGLVIYLARTLKANGAVFLNDVFDDDNLAVSVNHLLVIGFYLLNLGYAFLLFQLQPTYGSLTEAFNQLIVKVGWLLMSLGLIHLFNMFVFWRIRTHRQTPANKPVAPLPRSATPPAPLTPNLMAPSVANPNMAGAVMMPPSQTPKPQ